MGLVKLDWILEVYKMGMQSYECGIFFDLHVNEGLDQRGVCTVKVGALHPGVK